MELDRPVQRCGGLSTSRRRGVDLPQLRWVWETQPVFPNLRTTPHPLREAQGLPEGESRPERRDGRARPRPRPAAGNDRQSECKSGCDRAGKRAGNVRPLGRQLASGETAIAHRNGPEKWRRTRPRNRRGRAPRRRRTADREASVRRLGLRPRGCRRGRGEMRGACRRPRGPRLGATKGKANGPVAARLNRP